MNRTWPRPARPPSAQGRAAVLLAAVALSVAGLVIALRLSDGSPSVASSGPGRHGRSVANHRVGSGHKMPTGPLVPAKGALFGAWAEPSGGTSLSLERSFTGLENLIGRKLAIEQFYVPWTDPLPIQVVRWDLQRGTIPMISLAGASTKAVAGGAYDGQFRQYARALAALHRPVMLRWFAEMDGQADLPLIASPASFIAAWRHVHDLFRAAGATNVIWVWCPNAENFSINVSQLFYPGSHYVDWIGADGYNWAPLRPNTQWRSFASIFASFYQWGVATGKPLLVGEFGALEGRPGQKAAWLTQASQQLQTMFPAIKAVVYFDSDHQGYDWRVTTSHSALAAFRSFASQPYFRATAGA